jgi:hypothetical protein
MQQGAEPPLQWHILRTSDGQLFGPFSEAGLEAAKTEAGVSGPMKTWPLRVREGP